MHSFLAGGKEKLSASKTSDRKSRGPASKLAPRPIHMAIFYLRIAKNVCGHGLCKHFLKIWFRAISWREAWKLPQEMNSFSLDVVKSVRKGGWSFPVGKVGEMAPGVQCREWHHPGCQQQPAQVGLRRMQMLLLSVYPNLKSTINERKHALLQGLSSLQNSRTQTPTDWYQPLRWCFPLGYKIQLLWCQRCCLNKTLIHKVNQIIYQYVISWNWGQEFLA